MSSSRALVVPNAFMQSLSVTVLSEVPPTPHRTLRAVNVQHFFPSSTERFYFKPSYL